MEQFCPRCEDYRPTTEEVVDNTYNAEGRLVIISFVAVVCSHCKEEIGTDANDQLILDRVG